MGNLQEFFESALGKGVTIFIVAAIMVIILIIGRSDNKKDKSARAYHTDTLALALSAMLIAASLVLSNIKLFSMPQGGTVTPFSMLPIALCSYLIGTKNGVMAGTALGMINLMVNPYVIHPVQLLLDYPIAFASLGMGGPLRDTKAGLPGVYLVGILGRFICSTLSGVVFFSSYAEGTGMSPLLYSVVYNGTYIGAEGAITLFILFLPPVRSGISRIKTQLSN